MGNKQSKQKKAKKKGAKYEVDEPDFDEEEIAPIEPVSTKLFAELDSAYVKENGPLNRLFTCVTDSMKMWIPQLQSMETLTDQIFNTEIGAKHRPAFVKDVLLYSKTCSASNPRVGLLFRLITFHRDASETLEEQTRDLDALLANGSVEGDAAELARQNLRKLQEILDTYTRKQSNFDKRIRYEHGKAGKCPVVEGKSAAARRKRCIMCHKNM